jgi:endogenous inhibitor of DNA gyrase (YacG/DUF329 family)
MQRTTFTENGVLCPHCGEEFFFDELLSHNEEEEIDTQCPHCAKDMTVSWEQQFWYTAVGEV